MPTPKTAKWIDPDHYIWCGSMVQDGQGKCHLYYSRWPRKEGFQAWVTHSEVAHAVADQPLGPYRHADVALPPQGDGFWDGLCTHNPTIHFFEGKYCLFYTGNRGDGTFWSHRNNQRIGVAVSESPSGPWRRSAAPLIDVSADPDAPDALAVANPAVTARPGGGYLMVYKAVARKGELPFGGPVVHLAATASRPDGPYSKKLRPIFTKEGADFPAEDPYIWHQDGQYWAIVKDFNGYFTGAGKSLALFESPDGFDWKPARHPLVSRTEIIWEGGERQQLAALERPQLWMKDGRPAVLFCAADDTSDSGHSFNVQIPLRHWSGGVCRLPMMLDTDA